MKKSKVKDLNQKVLAPKLKVEVDNRWLVMKKRAELWTLKQLSEYTGIPKSTLASRTFGYNGSYNLLNVIFRDYILNEKCPKRIRNSMSQFASDKMELLGDYGLLEWPNGKETFYSKGQEKYNTKEETKDNLEEVADFLQYRRDFEKEEPTPLNLNFFIFLFEVICQNLMKVQDSITITTATPS